MKGKFNWNSKKKVKPISNIDLRIPKIPFSLSPKNKKITKKNSRTFVKRKTMSPAYSVNKIRKMNWKQLKQRFPGLSPTADADFDGLVNARDCRPLDPSKDGIFSRVLGKVTGDRYGQTAAGYKEEKAVKSEAAFEKKMEKDISRVKSEENIKRLKEYRSGQLKEKLKELKSAVESKTAEKIEREIKKIAPTAKERIAIIKRRRKGLVRAVKKFSGVRGAKSQIGKTAKGVKGAGAGRPKGSYKYTDPRTGQPITAVEYHRLRKQLKRQAKTVETQTEVKQRMVLAKRGLSPEEVAATQEQMNAKMARLRAIKSLRKGEAVEGYEVTPEGQVIEVEETIPTTPEGEVIVSEEEQVPQQQVEQVEYEGEPQQQIEQVQAMPAQVQYQQQQNIEPMTAVPGSYGIPPGYRVQDDLMTGRKRLVALPQQEAWTR